LIEFLTGRLGTKKSSSSGEKKAERNSFFLQGLSPEEVLKKLRIN